VDALNHLLSPARNCTNLRTRGHLYQLPEYSTNLHKSKIVFFSFFSLYVILILLFSVYDVRLSHLINFTYIHTCIHIYVLVLTYIEGKHWYQTPLPVLCRFLIGQFDYSLRRFVKSEPPLLNHFESAQLCANMTSSTKPEVHGHGLLYHAHSVKTGVWFRRYAREQTDRHT